MQTDKVDITVVAVLPFPVRVNPVPYEVHDGSVTWSLLVDRVQRQSFDERIVGPQSTNFDFERDRDGAASYSRVRGTATGLGPERQPVPSFLRALNRLIEHLRDVIGCFWIRALSPADLYQLSVTVANETNSRLSFGTRGGATLAVTGLQDDAHQRLVTSLGGPDPPTWRVLRLDAEDALDLGRHEEAIVLAWSALETACRTSLPALADKAGLAPRELGKLVRSSRKNPFSHEDAVERGQELQIVESAAQLTDPLIFHPESIRESVRHAYRLRNRVVHQGAGVSREDAARVFEEVRWVLEQALTLRNIPARPAGASWRSHFGTVSPDVQRFAEKNQLELIIAHETRPLGSFEMELINHQLWLRPSPGMGERLTAAFMVCQWRAWERTHVRQRPRLVAHPDGWLLSSGLVHQEAQDVEAAVALAEAGRELRRNALPIRDAAAWELRRLVDNILERPDPLAPNDIRRTTVAAHLASRLSILRPDKHALDKLAAFDPELAERAERWSAVMRSLGGNIHAPCLVYRRIAADSMWLDLIRIECPLERVTFGSGVIAWPTN